MKIGILGSGAVGSAIGGKLVALGHEVKMGSRTATNEKAAAWVASAGKGASQGTFADAASFGEIVFNCTNGNATLEVLQQAGAQNFTGKIVVDVSNPLDFSKGFPPSLSVANTDSLGEQVQRALPDAKVVKTLNTVSNPVMIDPARVKGDHDLFVCGNDAGAKAEVTRILREWFGWKHIIDLGDITQARGTEMYLPLWVRLYGVLGKAEFNIHVVT
ncbi:MAG TPA: NAD(P)-binding domain-containing protein [Nannocystaceae bacterium]|nr:NAD(P)-binding domain-containing protein [Nannocystaceae bacterium]